MFHHLLQFYLSENHSRVLSNVGQEENKPIFDIITDYTTIKIKNMKAKTSHHSTAQDSVKEEEWLVLIHHLSGQYFENQDDKNDGLVKNLMLIGLNATIVVCQLKMAQFNWLLR